MPFAQLILSHLADKPLVLAMDGSTVGRGCMALMVGVIYHKRAIPLAWIVYKGKKGHTTADHHIMSSSNCYPCYQKKLKSFCWVMVNMIQSRCSPG